MCVGVFSFPFFALCMLLERGSNFFFLFLMLFLLCGEEEKKDAWVKRVIYVSLVHVSKRPQH